jgi:hypothetical protein
MTWLLLDRLRCRLRHSRRDFGYASVCTRCGHGW